MTCWGVTRWPLTAFLVMFGVVFLLLALVASQATVEVSGWLAVAYLLVGMEGMALAALVAFRPIARTSDEGIHKVRLPPLGWVRTIEWKDVSECCVEGRFVPRISVTTVSGEEIKMRGIEDAWLVTRHIRQMMTDARCEARPPDIGG